MKPWRKRYPRMPQKRRAFWWDSIESHTEGFRGSRDYQRWKELLHHFYGPFPIVEHYLPLFSGPDAAKDVG